jgi:hypothetical protein
MDYLIRSDVGEVSFTFLGTTQVTYVNKGQRDTWKLTPKSAVMQGADGSSVQVKGGVFGAAAARLVRAQQAKSITITY